MKLLYQTHSPYARKVLVAAYEMGLHETLTVIHHETSPTRRNAEVFALNPLGKVPVLICDDGTVLFDSNVICEYLDGLHPGPPLIPSHPPLHFRALKMQALAQGIADAGITARWESERRPTELRWPAMHDGQIQKSRRPVISWSRSWIRDTPPHLPRPRSASAPALPRPPRHGRGRQPMSPRRQGVLTSATSRW